MAQSSLGGRYRCHAQGGWLTSRWPARAVIVSRFHCSDSVFLLETRGHQQGTLPTTLAKRVVGRAGTLFFIQRGPTHTWSRVGGGICEGNQGNRKGRCSSNDVNVCIVVFPWLSSQSWLGMLLSSTSGVHCYIRHWGNHSVLCMF